MRRLQGALATEKSLANQALLEAEIATSIQQRAQAGKAMQVLKQVKEGVEQGGTVRDFRGWLTDNGESLEKGNPIEMSKNGDILPTLDGLKQIVKITLSQKSVQETLETAAKVNPFVDRVLTAGNTLIDTGYDLTVEYLGFYQLKKADENSELFYRAAKALQQKNSSNSRPVEVLSVSEQSGSEQSGSEQSSAGKTECRANRGSGKPQKRMKS